MAVAQHTASAAEFRPAVGTTVTGLILKRRQYAGETKSSYIYTCPPPEGGLTVYEPHNI